MNSSIRRLLFVGPLSLFLFFAIFAFSPAMRSLGSFAHKPNSRPSESGVESEKWRKLAWLDEHGQVARDAYAKAVEQKMRLAALSPTGANSWIEQGPSNLAGRTRCLVINPASPLTMLMGSAGGGIWRSYDGGTTWNPVGDQLKSLAVNALTIDPNSSNTIYAGTGEGYDTYDAIEGYGIYRSTDGGTTWAQLPSTSSFPHVNRIAVDPANSSIILATVETGGIYRSTDTGTTWTSVYSANSGHAVVFCPSNPSRVVASVLDFNSSTSQWAASALVSNDAGKTWVKATSGLNSVPGMSRIEPMPTFKDATTIYASVTDGNVWKSTDGGMTYTEVTTSLGSGASLNANAIWVDPTNPLRVVVGGQNIFASTDGGITLSLIGEGAIQTVLPHPGIHWFAASPNYDGVTNKSVFVCTSGGVFQAADITTVSAGVGWIPHYLTARTSQYYSVTGDASTGQILGGLQDNGTQILAEGLSQSNAIFTGDGGFVAMDPTNPSKMYGESAYLQIFQSTDSGLDTQVITAGLTDSGSTSINYIAPLILDPNQPSTLLAGGASLWRCSKAGSSAPVWSSIRPADSAPISAIAVAPGNSDLIWVGQNDGSIAVTENGTSPAPTWKYVSGPKTSGPLPSRFITRILVDPSNSNLVYVALGGFTTNNLWESTDGGVTWNSITGTGSSVLPQVPIRAIARNPGLPNNLFVGTEVGVFSTQDGGATWTISSDLNVNVSVDELTYMNNSTTLLAATHGRGVWLLQTTPVTISSLTVSPATVLGGSSSVGTITLSQAASGEGSTVNLSVNSSDAQVPTTVRVPAGSSTATFTITTNGVSGSETISFTATLGSSHASAQLTIEPPTLSGLTISPSTLVGGNSATGTVTADAVAPVGGLPLSLSSNADQAIVPSTVTIPAGAKSATFPVTTTGVLNLTTATITAAQGLMTLSGSLTIEPASLVTLSVSPVAIAGGNPVTGTVTLNGFAPYTGLSIRLSSNSKSAFVPTAVLVPSGASTVTFSIATTVVTSITTATVTAVQGTVVQNSVLKILTSSLDTVSVSQGSVIGGSQTIVTGLISFTGPAPSSGETITLTSSNTRAVVLTGSVRLSSGKSSIGFAITHLRATTPQTVTITATCGGVVKTSTLTVNPFQLSTFTVAPSSVIGGNSVVGQLTLNAIPGSRGGPVVVSLASTVTPVKPTIVVSIGVGATAGKFTVTTTPVASPVAATLKATLGSDTLSTTLTVQPPAITSIVVKPTTVRGSSTTAVTGTVTLTGPAPTGGLIITLTSSILSATVPTSVTIPAGKMSATFKVGHTVVSLQSIATITASLNGASKATTLTLTP